MDPNNNSNGHKDVLERRDSVPNDSIHLKRRVGLISGIALIVGTMIGKNGT